ncbi:MAG: hypothetical protein JSU73_14135 [candidate division WOR-3 bacterium]|nr:MAG: hypothetical protein JSU73_14135 [candidate division WOR-3 bacterium]
MKKRKKARPARGKGTARRQPPQPAPAGPAVPEHRLQRVALAVMFLLPLFFYWKYLFGGQMLLGTDWLGAGGYQMRLFMTEYIKSHGNVAFWMPAILSGQPTLAAFFGDLFYPTQLFRLFIPIHVVWAWTFYLHLFVAGLGTYLFLRQLRVSVLPAALGGVAYMFAGSLITLTYAGHDGRLIGCALMPMAMYFLHRAMDRRSLLNFLLCGLMVALQLLSGHMQKVYYTVLILFAYFLFKWVRTIRAERSASVAVKQAGYFALGMGFALALSAIQYLPIIANMPYAARGSERGYEYATSWSMPIKETFDLISPSFSGILKQYRGTNPFKLHSEYMGLLPLVFALWGIVRAWKSASTRFFLASFVLTLLMAWGGNTPFYKFAYVLLPGVSKFRGPGMIFFLASFSIAVMAGIGLDRAMQWAGKKNWYRPRTGPFLAAMLAIVMTVDIGLSLKLWNDEEGFIRGVPPPGQYFGSDEVISFLKHDTLLYRILPMNYQRSDAGVLMGYGIQSAGGQMPNPLQNYQDFTGAGTSVMFQAGNLMQPNFLNLLNVKYVVSVALPDDDSRYDEQSRRVIRQLKGFFSRPQFQLARRGPTHWVYLNQSALPRAFVTSGYELAGSKEEVLARLAQADFDPGRTALLYEKPEHEMTGQLFASTSEIREYDANRIRLKAVLSGPGLLVLSENWHPDWKAYVDGKPAPVLRAYHTLRAVSMDRGEHEVVFIYESASYRNGSWMSLTALVLLLAVAVVQAARRRRPRS